MAAVASFPPGMVFDPKKYDFNACEVFQFDKIILREVEKGEVKCVNIVEVERSVSLVCGDIVLAVDAGEKATMDGIHNRLEKNRVRGEAKYKGRYIVFPGYQLPKLDHVLDTLDCPVYPKLVAVARRKATTPTTPTAPGPNTTTTAEVSHFTKASLPSSAVGPGVGGNYDPRGSAAVKTVVRVEKGTVLSIPILENSFGCVDIPFEALAEFKVEMKLAYAFTHQDSVKVTFEFPQVYYTKKSSLQDKGVLQCGFIVGILKDADRVSAELKYELSENNLIISEADILSEASVRSILSETAGSQKLVLVQAKVGSPCGSNAVTQVKNTLTQKRLAWTRLATLLAQSSYNTQKHKQNEIENPPENKAPSGVKAGSTEEESKAGDNKEESQAGGSEESDDVEEVGDDDDDESDGDKSKAGGSEESDDVEDVSDDDDETDGNNIIVLLDCVLDTVVFDLGSPENIMFKESSKYKPLCEYDDSEHHRIHYMAGRLKKGDIFVSHVPGNLADEALKQVREYSSQYPQQHDNGRNVVISRSTALRSNAISQINASASRPFVLVFARPRVQDDVYKKTPRVSFSPPRNSSPDEEVEVIHADSDDDNDNDDVQSEAKKCFAEKDSNPRGKASILIQENYRRHLIQANYRRAEKWKCITSWIRRQKALRRYARQFLKIRKSIIIIQSYARGLLCRRGEQDKWVYAKATVCMDTFTRQGLQGLLERDETLHVKPHNTRKGRQYKFCKVSKKDKPLCVSSSLGATKIENGSYFLFFSKGKEDYCARRNVKQCEVPEGELPLVCAYIPTLPTKELIKRSLEDAESDDLFYVSFTQPHDDDDKKLKEKEEEEEEDDENMKSGLGDDDDDHDDVDPPLENKKEEDRKTKKASSEDHVQGKSKADGKGKNPNCQKGRSQHHRQAKERAHVAERNDDDGNVQRTKGNDDIEKPEGQRTRLLPHRRAKVCAQSPSKHANGSRQQPPRKVKGNSQNLQELQKSRPEPFTRNRVQDCQKSRSSNHAKRLERRTKNKALEPLRREVAMLQKKVAAKEKRKHSIYDSASDASIQPSRKKQKTENSQDRKKKKSSRGGKEANRKRSISEKRKPLKKRLKYKTRKPCKQQQRVGSSPLSVTDPKGTVTARAAKSTFKFVENLSTMVTAPNTKKGRKWPKHVLFFGYADQLKPNKNGHPRKSVDQYKQKHLNLVMYTKSNKCQKTVKETLSKAYEQSWKDGTGDDVIKIKFTKDVDELHQIIYGRDVADSTEDDDSDKSESSEDAEYGSDFDSSEDD